MPRRPLPRHYIDVRPTLNQRSCNCKVVVLNCDLQQCPMVGDQVDVRARINENFGDVQVSSISMILLAVFSSTDEILDFTSIPSSLRIEIKSSMDNSNSLANSCKRILSLMVFITGEDPVLFAYSHFQIRLNCRVI
jgi:hypothetical protein